MRKTSRIPSEYRQVEYLESTGTQAIVTNIYPDMENDVVIAYADLDIYNHTKTMAIFGSSDGSSVFNSCGYTTMGHKFFMQVGGGSSFVRLDPTSGKHLFISNYKDNEFIVDENSIPSSFAKKSSPTPYVLFAQRLQEPFSVFLYGKIYSIEFVGKAKFIPCVRKSDSKPGMYDTVSKTFYTNAGTGEFIIPA